MWLAVTLPAQAAQAPIFATEQGALNGYDPVAMLDEGRVTLGSATFASDWRGTTWKFANADNQRKFMAEPDRFVPQYGGFCALGMSHGGLVPSDPEAFSVVDGKLYLNAGPKVRETWQYASRFQIERANKRWRERLEKANTATIANVPAAVEKKSRPEYGGLDPVSYFSGAPAQAGLAVFSVTWQGKLFWFINAENRRRFEQTPARFRPEFDGVSTVTLAHGLAIPANPQAYTLINGKLYFDFSDAVIATLNTAPQQIIARAQEQWQQLGKSK
jgi:YHS domain-containing protein